MSQNTAFRCKAVSTSVGRMPLARSVPVPFFSLVAEFSPDSIYIYAIKLTTYHLYTAFADPEYEW